MPRIWRSSDAVWRATGQLRTNADIHRDQPRRDRRGRCPLAGRLRVEHQHRSRTSARASLRLTPRARGAQRSRAMTNAASISGASSCWSFFNRSTRETRVDMGHLRSFYWLARRLAAVMATTFSLLPVASGNISRKTASTSLAASRPLAPMFHTTSDWPGASAKICRRTKAELASGRSSAAAASRMSLVSR